MSNESKLESSDLPNLAQEIETRNSLPKTPRGRWYKVQGKQRADLVADTETPLESGPVTVNLPNDTFIYTSTHNAQITALSEETGRTREEIITAALTLYELALKAQAHNKKFGVVEPDQQLITEVGSL